MFLPNHLCRGFVGVRLGLFRLPIRTAEEWDSSTVCHGSWYRVVFESALVVCGAAAHAVRWVIYRDGCAGVLRRYPNVNLGTTYFSTRFARRHGCLGEGCEDVREAFVGRTSRQG